MRLDINDLKYLSVEQQDRFLRTTSEIVVESFVFTADRDYLTARFAFFQKQSHLFLWSAAQAVEKYLKANILLLGEGVIAKIHKLSDLSKNLAKSHPERLVIQTCIPEGWLDQGVVHWPVERIEDFLLRLEVNGSPDVRYDQHGVDECLQDLVLLDRLAFGLREGLVSQQVSECRHVGKLLVECFYDLNFSFAPADYQHPSLFGIALFHQSVPTLEAALNGCYGHSSLYREWAQKSLMLHPKAIERLIHSKQ